MPTDNDNILIPSFAPNTRRIKPLAIRRGLAKEILAAKNNTRAMYNLSLNNRISLQAVHYISRLPPSYIEQADEYKGSKYK